MISGANAVRTTAHEGAGHRSRAASKPAEGGVRLPALLRVRRPIWANPLARRRPNSTLTTVEFASKSKGFSAGWKRAPFGAPLPPVRLPPTTSAALRSVASVTCAYVCRVRVGRKCPSLPATVRTQLTGSDARTSRAKTMSIRHVGGDGAAGYGPASHHRRPPDQAGGCPWSIFMGDEVLVVLPALGKRSSRRTFTVQEVYRGMSTREPGLPSRPCFSSAPSNRLCQLAASAEPASATVPGHRRGALVSL